MKQIEFLFLFKRIDIFIVLDEKKRKKERKERNRKHTNKEDKSFLFKRNKISKTKWISVKDALIAEKLFFICFQGSVFISIKNILL